MGSATTDGKIIDNWKAAEMRSTSLLWSHVRPYLTTHARRTGRCREQHTAIIEPLVARILAADLRNTMPQTGSTSPSTVSSRFDPAGQFSNEFSRARGRTRKRRRRSAASSAESPASTSERARNGTCLEKTELRIERRADSTAEDISVVAATRTRGDVDDETRSIPHRGGVIVIRRARDLLALDILRRKNRSVCPG